MPIEGREEGRRSQHQHARVLRQKAVLHCGLAPPIGIQRTRWVGFEIGPAERAIEHQIAGEAGERHARPGASLRKAQRARGIGRDAFALGRFRLVDAHPSGGIDHSPRLMERQGALDARRVVEVKDAPVGQHVVECTPLTAAGEGLAERAGGADDQDRTAGAYAAATLQRGFWVIDLAPDRLKFQPHVPAPPAFRGEDRVVEALTAGKRRKLARQRRRPGGSAANVEDAAFVGPGRPGQEAVPVEGAQEGPGGDRANLDPARPQPGRGVPGLLDPAHLFLAGAAVVDLGDGKGTAIARPHLKKGAFEPAGTRLEHPYSLHISELHEGVSAVPLRRVAVQPMVQKAIAGQIVVQSHHVGRAGGVSDGGKPVAQAKVGETSPQRMMPGDAPAEQIPAHPAARVVELCLMRQGRGGVGAANVLRLDQPGGRDDLADSGHGATDRIDLVDQRRPESRLRGKVGMPMSVQGREPRGGQRLVDRGPVLHPIEAPRGGAGEIGQAGGESRVQKVRVTGTGTVVGQADDGADVQGAHPRQPLIDPAPVLGPCQARRHALPEAWIA